MPKMDRPRVIIAPADHAFGMARIFEIEGEATRPNLHVVRSAKEAFVIFGVEMEEAQFGPISGLPFTLVVQTRRPVADVPARCLRRSRDDPMSLVCPPRPTPAAHWCPISRTKRRASRGLEQAREIRHRSERGGRRARADFARARGTTSRAIAWTLDAILLTGGPADIGPSLFRAAKHPRPTRLTPIASAPTLR